MKITKSRLKQIIREELDSVTENSLNEWGQPKGPMGIETNYPHGQKKPASPATSAQPNDVSGGWTDQGRGQLVWRGIKIGTRTIDAMISPNNLTGDWFLSLEDKAGAKASVDDLSSKQEAIKLMDDLVKNNEAPEGTPEKHKNLWNFRNGRSVNEVAVTKQQPKLAIKETLPARPYDDPDRIYGPRYPESSEEAILWLDGLLEKDGKPETQFLDYGDRDTLLGISHWLKGLTDMVSENEDAKEDAKEDAEDKPVIALKLKSKIDPMLPLSVQRRLRARERLKGRSGYRYEPPEDNQS